MECPKECDQHLGIIDSSIVSLKKTLYGEDGMKGLVSCVNKSVKRGQLVATTIAVLTLLAVFVVYGMGSFAAEKEKRHTNSEEIVGIKAQVEALDLKVGAALVQQGTMADDLRKIKAKQQTKQELFKLMKDAVKAAKAEGP